MSAYGRRPATHAARPHASLVSAAIMVAAVLCLFAPSGAAAASAILEYQHPAASAPVPFTIEGGETIAEMAEFEPVVHCAHTQAEGQITGPRSSTSSYRFTGCHTERGASTKCKTEGAGEEEITTGPIEAELVWINQAAHDVGELIDPHGGTYIAFECGGEAAEGQGPFLARIAPIDTDANVFTASLTQSGSVQTPEEYEGPGSERLHAVPKGKHGEAALVSTGVESTFVVHPSIPVTILAVTRHEVEGKERAEEEARHAEDRKREEEALDQAGARRETEETAARRAREEAFANAARQRTEEQVQGESAAHRVTLSDLRARVLKHSVVLSMRTSVDGVLTVSGHGIRPISRALKAGAVQVSVMVKPAAYRAARRRTLRITLRLHPIGGTATTPLLSLKV